MNEETRKPKRKFEIGDKVKIIGSVELLGMCGLGSDKVGMIGVVTGYGCKDYHGNLYFYIINGCYFPEVALKLVESKEKQSNEIRQFGTGATRDADNHPEKPSYYKALSPIVLREYVKYLGRHRTQTDGSKRDWDNWKAGIPIDVYMDGLLRHTMAVWLIQQGFRSYDNHGEVNTKDSLCGVMFNSIGMLHEILKEEIKAKDKAYYNSITKMIDEKPDRIKLVSGGHNS